MIPDTVNANLISPAGLLAWAQTATASLTALLHTPQINLGHLEELLERQARALVLPILRAAAHALAAQQPFRCPSCRSYWHPADAALGLQPQAPASPRVQEIAALMSIRSP